MQIFPGFLPGSMFRVLASLGTLSGIFGTLSDDFGTLSDDFGSLSGVFSTPGTMDSRARARERVCY